jgi:hypothetical protein
LVLVVSRTENCVILAGTVAVAILMSATPDKTPLLPKSAVLIEHAGNASGVGTGAESTVATLRASGAPLGASLEQEESSAAIDIENKVMCFIRS